MPDIKTLIKDVNHVVEKQPGWFDQSLAEGYSRELGLRLVEVLGPRDEVPRLRLSAMGENCPRSLWASIHSPSVRAPLPARAIITYTYGAMIEAFAIAMARAAGHEVTGEQDELVVDGVKGHRDCVIDGCIVDVKSINGRGFQEVRKGAIRSNPFLRGYLDQLDGYVVGSLNDDLVRVKDRGYLWFINKEQGAMHLYEHIVRPDSIKQRIAEYKSIVSSQEPPTCTCKTVPDGESGNIKLDTKASYNPYRYFCFPHLRCFLYADGPRYLTRVVRVPDVPEVDRNGVIMIH